MSATAATAAPMIVSSLRVPSLFGMLSDDRQAACLGDGVHGGDILRGLVHGLAVQVFDREVEVDLGILAELFKVCEHFIR